MRAKTQSKKENKKGETMILITSLSGSNAVSATEGQLMDGTTCVGPQGLVLHKLVPNVPKREKEGIKEKEKVERLRSSGP
jgi:hypothetical protein